MVIERTDAKKVSQEVVVKRSIFLDHLPTNFDVAFTRAREALMIHGGQHRDITTDTKGAPPAGVLDKSIAERSGRIALDSELKQVAQEQKIEELHKSDVA